MFPGLASGALAVQVGDDFSVSEGTYGWALGSFFLAAAITSVPAGKLVQHLGPRRQLLIGLALAATTQLVLATAVNSFAMMLVCLAVAGIVNSAVQTAVNLALTQAELPRLGLAVATKQAAMPASAMLGGLAVPALALTLGWRWAYAMGAAVAAMTVVLVMVHIADRPVAPRAAAVVESSRGALRTAAVVSMLFAFSSGAINAWTVSSGVDAGLEEGTAGLLLSLAALGGIVIRLTIGTRVDKSTAEPFRAAAVIFIVGIAGFSLMALRVPLVHAFATFLAFGGGWVWPVHTNFAIVNANPRSAGAATGMTQTGVYVGVFSAPVISGLVIDRFGYPTMWLGIAALGLAAVALSLRLSPEFPVTSR